jgi:hypothetical protein
VKVIYYQTLDLKGTGDEQTAVRFTLEGQDVLDVNTTPKSLVELTRSNAPKGGSGSGSGGPVPSLDAATGQAVQQ